jgi:multiple RNA-binding domain-containing protein 1
MDVMKGGADASNPSSTAVPGDASWVAEGKGKVAPKPKKQKGKEKAEEAEGDEEEAEDAPEDDDDAAWLANRRKETITEVEEDEDEEDEETGTKVDPEEALILSTGRLFVRNLAFVTTAEDLTSAFERFGPLVDVHMPVSQKTGEPLGTAFILFRNPEDAVSARKTLDKKTFQGRLLHILPGRARPGQESTTDTKGITDGKVLGKAVETRGEVKDKVDEKRKADGARGVNWATLYMNVSYETLCLS